MAQMKFAAAEAAKQYAKEVYDKRSRAQSRGSYNLTLEKLKIEVEIAFLEGYLARFNEPTTGEVHDKKEV